MRMSILCALFVSAVACVPEAGVPGAAAEPVSAGPHWADANGVYVAVPGALVHFDATGLVWEISAETGQPAEQGRRALFYEASDCSGPVFVYAMPPRQTLRILGDEAYYSRPDTLATARMCGASTDFGQGCTAQTQCPYADEMLEFSLLSREDGVQVPELPWVGPLHLEAGQ